MNGVELSLKTEEAVEGGASGWISPCDAIERARDGDVGHRRTRESSWRDLS